MANPTIYIIFIIYHATVDLIFFLQFSNLWENEVVLHWLAFSYRSLLSLCVPVAVDIGGLLGSFHRSLVAPCFWDFIVFRTPWSPHGGHIGGENSPICTQSMEWFKGKSMGNHRFSIEIWGFPLNCPLKPIH